MKDRRSGAPKRLAIAVARLAAIVVVGVCATVMIVGLLIARPHHQEVGPPPADLANAEVVVIPSASGSALRGWWIPGRSGGGAVVLMHGLYADRRAMARRARILRDHGFAVLLFDFEAEGESPGKAITFGHLEALDAAAAVAFVWARAPRERIGSIGVSLGGAASLLGPRPLPVEAMILESAYPDVDAALANRLRIHLGPILGPLLTPALAPLFEILLPPVIGVTPDELRPANHIAAVTVPLLVASGTADDRTPIGDARSMFDRARTQKQFWAVPGAGHVDLESYDPAAYWRVVLPVLTRNLQRGAAVGPAPAVTAQ